MSNRQGRESRNAIFFASSGWLFADFLLALAMLFMAINTIAVKPPPPTSTPTPTPTPKPLPRLELSYHRVKFQVNAPGLLRDDTGAKEALKKQITSLSFLKQRRAGLVIAYGGAPTINDIQNAYALADKVYDNLKELGRQKFVFIGTSYYDHLYILGEDSSIVELDIYLFEQ